MTVPLYSTTVSANSIKSKAQQGNPNLLLKAIPHRVVYQHYTLLEAKLTYHDQLLKGRTISFYIQIGQTWEFIGTNMTNSKGIAEIFYFIEIPQGNYKIRAEFLGDAEYKPVTDEKTITILEASLNITFNPLTIRYSDEAIFQSRLVNPAENPIPNRNVTYSIYLDDWIEIGTTIKTDKDGYALLPSDIFYSPDTYNIKVTFKGGKQYGIGEEIFYDSLTILKEITEIPTILDYTINYGDDIYIFVRLTDDEGIPIADEELIYYLYYDSAWHELGSAKSNSEGYSFLLYSANLVPGTYNLKVIHTENPNYLGIEKEGFLQIVKENTNIILIQTEGEYSDEVFIPAQLTDDNLVPNPIGSKILDFSLEISLNNWLNLGTAITSEDGWAYRSWTLNILPNYYNLKVQFQGDDYYEPNQTIFSSGLIIERETLILSDPTKEITFNQYETIGTIVTDNDFNPVSGISIDVYIASGDWVYIDTIVSDADGIATLSFLITFSVGIHEVKFSVAETPYYEATEIVGTLRIVSKAVGTALTLLGGPWVGASATDPEHLNNPDIVTFTAKLTDQNGANLPNKQISFYYGDASTSTWTLMGSGATNSEGLAYYTYIITCPINEYDVKAEFLGDIDYNSDSDIKYASNKQGLAAISHYGFQPTNLWTLTHAGHDVADFYWFYLIVKLHEHFYYCFWESHFKFSWQVYYYYNYYAPARGWNPSYEHEFRSRPHDILEAELTIRIGNFYVIHWFETDMPGQTGCTDSDEWEEVKDGDEEIEIYTKNPELFASNTEYYAKIRYRVMNTNSGEMRSKAEVGHKDHPYAWVSPPGYPVEWSWLNHAIGYPKGMPSWNEPFSHTDYCYREWVAPWDDPWNTSLDTHIVSKSSLVQHFEFFPYQKIRILGLIPNFSRIEVSFDIDSTSDLTNYINNGKIELQKFSEQYMNSSESNQKIHVIITCNELLSPEEYIILVNKYNIDVITFGYESCLNNHIITGQASPLNGQNFPAAELYNFTKGNFSGIFSLYGKIPIKNLLKLQNESKVLFVDITPNKLYNKYSPTFDNLSIEMKDLYYFYKNYGVSELIRINISEEREFFNEELKNNNFKIFFMLWTLIMGLAATFQENVVLKQKKFPKIKCIL